MASSSSSSVIPAFLTNNRSSSRTLASRCFTRRSGQPPEIERYFESHCKWKKKRKNGSVIVSAKSQETPLQYKKLGDSDLVISEITLGTMTFGEQNTEKEAHEQLSYAFERGINALDTAETESTEKYLEVAKKHGVSLVKLALSFARDRPFVTSSIIGATTMDQLREDIDAFLTTERPLPHEIMADIENVSKRYKDPAID